MGCSKAFYCVSRKVSAAFARYGQAVGRWPLVFIVLPVLACAGMGVGFMWRVDETDIEALYTPVNSRSRADRQRVKDIFPDGTGEAYNPMNINDHPLNGIVVFRPRNGSNVLTEEALEEIRQFSKIVQQWRDNTTDGQEVTFEDTCGKANGKCLVWGDVILGREFWEAYVRGEAFFPFWTSSVEILDLSVWLGHVLKNESDVILEAGALKLAFTLRQDSEENKERSREWERIFIRHMQELDDDHFKHLLFAFSSSQSMGTELDRGTKGDIMYFSLTFTLMITYASIVSSGGDCVSTRALLANAGVIAATMGIMASFGLFSFLGVKFVNIVGVVPFLVLGIGVDDMFLMMSAWSGTQSNRDLSVPKRIGATFRAAGIGITITSVTDFLAFAIGSSSVFLSVRNFCLYAGVAVLFCYICQCTFFAGCLALHGRRVYSGRHTLTCKKLRARKDMSEDGERCCKICMCGGATPSSDFEDESPFEKGPRLLLPRLVMWNPFKAVVMLVFAGYIAVSIYGIMFHLEQGLRLKDLVLDSSYYHRFNTWDEEDFGVAFPVAFVLPEPMNYTDRATMAKVFDLMSKGRDDPDISTLGTYCWYTDYIFSPYVNITSEEGLARSVRDLFLPDNPRYKNDVVFSPDGSHVLASRCHVFSNNVKESTQQAELMKRMREIADTDSLPGTFAYQPAFVYFEQYVMIMHSTLKTVGITLAVMFVITFIFLVHPTIVLLVFLNIVMIIVGIFGFMGLWGLTLSSVTMIHLIMSVGFSVDFSAHVCSAYMMATGRTRKERAQYALVHASGPILNSGLSSLIGIVVLVFSDSYIFQSFFKIMLLVIGFGVLHAVFLIPVLLSWIGPLGNKGEDTLSSQLHPSNGHTHGNGNVSAVAYTKRGSMKDGETALNGHIVANGQKNGQVNGGLAMEGGNHRRPSLVDTLGYLGAENKAFSDL